MSKKRFIILVILGFLLVNVALAIVFTLPSSEHTQNMANNEIRSSIKGSYDNTPVPSSQITENSSATSQKTPIVNIPASNAHANTKDLESQISPEGRITGTAVLTPNSQESTQSTSSPEKENIVEPPAQKPEPTPSPTPAPTSTPSPTPAPTPTPSPTPNPAPAPRPTPAQEAFAGKLTNISISYTSNINVNHVSEVLIIRIQADKPLKARTLYVGNPERAILDLRGKWELTTIPAFPSTKYSTGIRTGFIDGYTRFVIDIATKNFTRELIQVDANTVELRVHCE